MTLREVLQSAADDAGIKSQTEADGATTWLIGGRPFALLDAAGKVAAFCLDPALAGAARRTPDTAASSRGAEWVEFAPPAVDGHAADRAAAWFIAAARRATT